MGAFINDVTVFRGGVGESDRKWRFFAREARRKISGYSPQKISKFWNFEGNCTIKKSLTFFFF